VTTDLNASSPVPASPAEATPAAVRDRSIAPAHAPGADALAKRVEAAADRRTLLDELLASSAAEAPYIAAAILRECMDVANDGWHEKLIDFQRKASQEPQLRNAQVAAFERLKQPCARLSGRSVTLQEIEALEAEGVSRGDPRAIARALALGKYADKGHASQLAAQLLESGDPYAMKDIATWLVGQTGRATIMGAQVVTADLIPANLAWQLVACSYGYPCGADNPQVLSSCAFDGICKDSYENLLRNARLSPQQYQRVIELRQRIEAALQAKDYASLGIGSAGSGSSKR